MVKVSKLLWWRLALAACLIACLGMLGALWLSGDAETDDAFASGRRLLIAIDGGAVEGHMATTLPPVTQAPPEPPPAPEAPPAPEPPVTEPPAPAAQDAPPADPVAAEAAPQEMPPVAVPETAPQEAPPAETTAEPAAEILPGPEVPAPATPIEEAPAPELPSIEPSALPPNAPSEPLMEKTDAGLLPIIGSDGTKPWRHYAKPFERRGGQPMIAIVVTGLGYNKRVAERALRLPENVSLSFAPYAANLTSWATSARLAGHETLIDLPMEPSNYPVSDPGPYGLIVDKGPSENNRRLEWLMTRFGGFVGFLTPQHEKFSADVEGFKILLQSLANRGLMLAVGREPFKSETKTVIEASNTAIVVADALIDEELAEVAMQTRLTALEELAKKRGYAVGIIQAYPLSVEQIGRWAQTLKEKGIVLAPVTAVARLRFS